MTQTTTDRIPVVQLPDRYKISRSVLYERISALQIKPEKQGNKAFIDAFQLDRLDRLHDHIQSGGDTPGFLAAIGQSARQLTRQSARQLTRQSARQSTGQLAHREEEATLTITPQQIALLLNALAPCLPAAAPLAHLEAIEKAYQHGWLLNTSELAVLLGLKSLTGKSIRRYGFIFTRVGRNGSESAWSIQKG